MKKLFRISTVPMSLNILLKGQLRYLNQFYSVTAISGEGTDLQAVKQREKVKVFTIEMSRTIAPLKDLHSLILLYHYFKKEKPIIIHTITPKAGLLAMVAGKFAGVPVRMHTFTGLIFPTRKGLMQKVLIQMDRFLCSCATHIFPEGQGVKRDLEMYKITDKPLKVIANGNVNGIDTEFFSRSQISEAQQQELRRDLGILPEDFVFIFVGRLVGDKGINELVEAFKEIALPKAKLLLVGPLETDLDPLDTATLAEIETNKNIITAGYQNDVRLYFAISHVLVFPSYREGFPNVVLQAGALELPAIVSNINGCNEIIIEGRNGTIIPVKDVQSLKSSMTEMYQNEPWREKLQSQARSMITSRYDQQVVWQAILAEYRAAEKTIKHSDKF